MKKINKKSLIVIIAICTIAVVIGIVLICKNIVKGTEAKESSKASLHLYTHQVIDIDDLDTSLYASSKNKLKKFKIASKYKVGKEAYTFDADVDMYLDNNMAKAIYIRDNDTKLNIVQLKYNLKHDGETQEVTQVEEMMRNFEMECKSNMGDADLEKKPNEVSISDDKTPYSESVYQKKELYSARYIVKEDYYLAEEDEEMDVDMNVSTKTYDINFYMDGKDTLVCEFVRVL